jgi:hypothetical protein
MKDFILSWWSSWISDPSEKLCKEPSNDHSFSDRNLCHTMFRGPSWPWSYGSWIYNYLCNQCLSLLMLWVRISFRARCTTLCDKVCQWLCWWFFPRPPVFSTNKTDRHDIIEILLKVALNTTKQTNKHTMFCICGHVKTYFEEFSEDSFQMVQWFQRRFKNISPARLKLVDFINSLFT